MDPELTKQHLLRSSRSPCRLRLHHLRGGGGEVASDAGTILGGSEALKLVNGGGDDVVSQQLQNADSTGHA